MAALRIHFIEAERAMFTLCDLPTRFYWATRDAKYPTTQDKAQVTCRNCNRRLENGWKRD